MSYEFPLERGKIREFALATRSSHPRHLDDDAVIPPTFLTHAGMGWSTPEDRAGIDFDHSRVLHGEEEYEFFGPPPRAGQTLQVTARLGETWEKTGRRGGTMRFAQLVQDFHDGSGALVARQTSVVIETAARS